VSGNSGQDAQLVSSQVIVDEMCFLTPKLKAAPNMMQKMIKATKSPPNILTILWSERNYSCVGIRPPNTPMRLSLNLRVIPLEPLLPI